MRGPTVFDVGTELMRENDALRTRIAELEGALQRVKTRADKTLLEAKHWRDMEDGMAAIGLICDRALGEGGSDEGK